jgi:hypothetical protein
MTWSAIFARPSGWVRKVADSERQLGTWRCFLELCSALIIPAAALPGLLAGHDCLLIAYQCTCTHSPHPPLQPYTRFVFSLTSVA